MQKSLFLGRFQPFHLGHLSVVKKIIESGEFLIIAIGSAENHHELDNPFTASERWEMITATLDDENIAKDKYTIIPVRDINDHANWVSHILRILPVFSKIYTGSELTKKLFQENGNYEICDIEFENKICASKIRQLIKEKGNYQKFVPQAVFEYLEPILDLQY